MTAYVPAIDEFLKELRLQFDRLIDVKERLDNKANNMMTMSGTVATILMGIGVFIVKSVNCVSSLLVVMLSIFAIGISFLIASIILNIIAHRLRTQDYPMGSKKFFDKRVIQPNTVTEYSTAHKIDFQEMIVNEYLDCILDAEEKINHKGYLMKLGQISFLIGLSVVPIILFITISVFKTVPTN